MNDEKIAILLILFSFVLLTVAFISFKMYRETIDELLERIEALEAALEGEDEDEDEDDKFAPPIPWVHPEDE